MERIARGDKPVSTGDKFAMEHDLDYYKIGELKKQGTDPETINRLVREADQKFINGIKNNPDKGLSNRIKDYIGRQLISGKNQLENIGVLDKQKFIGNGLHKKRTNHKRKKK